jgi:hypothetical protein
VAVVQGLTAPQAMATPLHPKDAAHQNTVVRGQDQQKNKKSKNKYQIFGKKKFSKKIKLHGEKENFAKYSHFWHLPNCGFLF